MHAHPGTPVGQLFGHLRGQGAGGMQLPPGIPLLSSQLSPVDGDFFKSCQFHHMKPRHSDWLWGLPATEGLLREREREGEGDKESNGQVSEMLRAKGPT